jgi:dTDP-4-amino-4,6-dideoxygalactose transaminase
MGVPLLDLQRQYEYLKPELDRAIQTVLEHQKFILGPEVAQLEEAIADLCGVDYGIGVASGTDAVLIALRAVGVASGDEVITSDFSFFASAGVIARLGAKPVFVDIDPDTYNIDANLVEAAVTERTKAIIPVHLFGQSADMDPIMQVASRHGVAVIEDAAQAIGAEYKGHPLGSMGALGCFSFYPSKNLGGAGDGGMIVTKSEDLYRSCRSLRAHGENPKYYHRTVGYNSRLDTLQAAILLVKLKYLGQWSDKRREHATRYNEALADLPGLKTPVEKEYATRHIYNQYTLASSGREAILDGLNEAGIGHCIYYPVAFHAQDCFASLGYTHEQFPESTRAAQEAFSIPVYPELTEDEQAEVIETLRRLVVRSG